MKLNTLCYNSENLSFKYDVSVDKSGRFTTTIPKEVTEKLMGIGVKLRQNKRHNHGFFSADSLGKLEDEVSKTADKFSKKELIDEKIIIKYAVDTCCSYCRGTSGKLYPNGSWEEEFEGYENGYHWVEGTKKYRTIGPCSIEAAFEICKLKNWKFPNGEVSKEYLNLEESDVKDDELLNWLNSLRGLSFARDSNIKEMEYSPQIGNLFKHMVLNIFNINEKIHQIFGGEFDLDKLPLKSAEKLMLMDGLMPVKSNGKN